MRRPTPAGAAQASVAPETATSAPAADTATIAPAERAIPTDMVEVRQLSIDAGPDGVAHPGEIRIIPIDDPMIEGGFVQVRG